MKTLLWDSMNTITKLYESHLAPVSEKYAMTRAELDILLFFANNPKYDRAVDVIEVRKVAKSHVSVSIQDLLKMGYLQAVYDKDNQRDIHLHVTSKADPILKIGRKAQDQFVKTLFHGFRKEEKEQMRASIEKMMMNAEQYFEAEK